MAVNFLNSCDLMVQIKFYWFHSKKIIFDQVMAKNGAYAIFGHTCFGHFWSRGLNFLWELKRLFSTEKCVMIITSYDAYFLGHFWRETRRCHRTRPLIANGMGPPNPTKKLKFLANCYLEIELKPHLPLMRI